jgi:hypothetical protein
MARKMNMYFIEAYGGEGLVKDKIGFLLGFGTTKQF